jgi:hypothetical protein
MCRLMTPLPNEVEARHKPLTLVMGYLTHSYSPLSNMNLKLFFGLERSIIQTISSSTGTTHQELPLELEGAYGPQSGAVYPAGKQK